jgi:hypothetical protein
MKSIIIKMQFNSPQYGCVSVFTTPYNMNNRISLRIYNHKKMGLEFSYTTPLFDGPIIIHHLLLRHLRWSSTTRKTKQ